MKKYLFTINILFLMLVANALTIKAQNPDNQNFEISKNLDIFNSLFKELNMFYVDSIDVKSSVQTGIDAMLKELDPYTVYYPEDKISDFKFLATGEYEGIGAGIADRDGKIIISDPYEGMPAALSGLQAGDEILEIDGTDIKKLSTTEASEKLKGLPGTKVKVKYLRPGAKKPTEVEIMRKRIQINPVTYYGTVKDKVGYIYLSGFTNESSAEVKKAFEDLKKNQQISSLIIDLRNNGGGLMDDAIQLVNMFVPKGKVVVSTKGKTKQWDRTYRTTQESIDEEIPLVLLVNNYSASSSEIVAGALQDMDRAVIIGSRTFGKGLVQSPREIAYNGSLKVTTSKYYIPSGRCIQAIDYTHRNSDGTAGVIPDSLTSVFETANGRQVRDGGGITPDIPVEDDKTPNIAYYLLSKYIVFDFATEWKMNNKSIGPVQDFVFTDQNYEKFKEFVKNKNFDYDRQSEKALKILKETMEFEGYLNSASDELTALEEKLKPDLDRDLDRYKRELSKLISYEIVKRYYYEKGEIIESLKNDKELDKAIETLSDREAYNKILQKPQV